MNIKLISVISLATATLAIAVPTFSQSVSSEEDKVSFSCQEIFDPASEQLVPATVAWVPQRGETVPVIYWKSEFFSAAGWVAQARCEEVTPKFQAFYDRGQLNYLTHGKVGPYPVICATVTDNEETCNQDNQLFTLKRGADGKETLRELMNIVESENAPLYHSPIPVIYVDFNSFLLNAPAVIELDSRSSFYNNRGLVYYEQGKLEFALADFNKAIAINHNYAEAYYNRGNLYYIQEESDKAIADYDRAIAINHNNPNNADVYYSRGNLYYNQGKLDKALADFEQAIDINSNLGAVYYNRGVIYEQKGDIEAARTNFKKALQLYIEQNDRAIAEQIANKLQQLP